MSDKKQRYYPLLDILRGPAALLVFAEHWRNLFFVDYQALNEPNNATRLFYLLTGAGHQAVVIFFVLSGCVIAHVIQTMIERDLWSWPRYLYARITRLWIVLIPALALTLVWDTIGLSLSTASKSIYSGSSFGNIINAPVSENSGVFIFFGNILFLQTIFVPTYGSNGPLWSIAFEFIYYISYPAIVFAFMPGIRYQRVISAGFAFLVLWISGGLIFYSFTIWLAGVVSYWSFRKFPSPSRISSIGFIITTVTTIACVVAARVFPHKGWVDWDLLIAFSTASSLYFGMSVTPNEQLTKFTKPFHGLSSLSYSIYLLHMPLLVFFASCFFDGNSVRWQPEILNILTGALLAILVFGYCGLIWFFTERQTKKIQDWCWHSFMLINDHLVLDKSKL